jgi:DNA-binding response OmpR family regulator
MRILIVEDDAMIGESLVRGLTDDGHAVDWVRDGRHAESALRDCGSEFQIMLLDLGLPQQYAPLPAKAFLGEEQHTFVVTIEFRPPSR